MSIDLDALRRACEGDPDVKIAVKRKWLSEVYRELVKREAVKKTDDFLSKVAAGLYGGPHR